MNRASISNATVSLVNDSQTVDKENQSLGLGGFSSEDKWRPRTVSAFTRTDRVVVTAVFWRETNQVRRESP